MQSLWSLSVNKWRSKQIEKENNALGRKHKYIKDHCDCHVRCKFQLNAKLLPSMHAFLELPLEDKVKQCYCEFFDATSSASLMMAVCGVCGREVDCRENGIVY